MIIGVISDTHEDKMKALPHVVAEILKRGAQIIVHCGDIAEKQISPDLFQNKRVICALTEEQTGGLFQFPPDKWLFTTPGNRVVNLSQLGEQIKIYVGHKRFFELLRKSEADFMETLETISRDYDCVRWLFGGHTHRQVFMQSNIINCLNPGAVENSLWGYEFALINTQTNEVTFSRIPPEPPTKKAVKVAVISDSRNISELSPKFWQKLAKELKKRRVSKIIHCGNLATSDIGKKELEDFTVYYNLRQDQENPEKVPNNWKFINPEQPIVKVNGYRFCVQHDLGKSLLYESEMGMLKISLKLVEKYPAIEFVLFGLTHQAFLEENDQVDIINPGDVVKDQSFAVIELPRKEITFSCIPPEPLPAIRS